MASTLDFSETLKSALESDDSAIKLKLMHIKKQLPEEIDRLFEVPERTDFHPEGNSGEHMLLTIKEVAEKDPKTATMMRYAMLVHDLGKIVTFDEQRAKAEAKGEHYEVKDLTKHFGHAEKGVDSVGILSDKLNVPAEWKEFATLVCSLHMKAHDIDKMKPAKLYEMNQAIPDRFYQPFMDCCLADTLGRDIPQVQKDQIRTDFKFRQNKMDDVRNYMTNHPELNKETFASAYVKHCENQQKTTQSQIEGL